MSALTTSEGMWLAGHRLSGVSGVCPRQADKPGAALFILNRDHYYYGIMEQMLEVKCFQYRIYR